jgi:hypothetical protein
MFRCTDNAQELLGVVADVDHQLADARRESVARAVTAGAEEARRNHRFQSRTGATVAGIQGYVAVATEAEVVGVLESTEETSVFLNDGTQPHEIVPKSAKVLRFETNGKVVFAARAQHPGTAPDPFFDHGVERAEEVFAEELEAALDRILGE